MDYLSFPVFCTYFINIFTTDIHGTGEIFQRNLSCSMILQVFGRPSENKGLELNSKKTESMIITRKTSIPKCEIKIKENTIKQANSFKYLGTQITSDGRNPQEIKSRIAQAKASSSK